MNKIIAEVIRDAPKLLAEKQNIERQRLSSMIANVPQGQLGSTEREYTANQTQELLRTLNINTTTITKLGVKATQIDTTAKSWLPFITRGLSLFRINIPYNDDNVTLLMNLMNMYTQKVQANVGALPKIPILTEEIWLKIFSYISSADKEKMLMIKK